MKKAICLLSGGLDSAVVMYTARGEGYETVALTFQYGQRHEKEVEYAKMLAANFKLKHWIVPIAMPWKASALLDHEIAVPLDRDPEKMNREIPATYVPARNSIFLSLAASLAEAEGAEAIFIGANAIDYSGYPDCRPEYLEAFSKMLELGTKVGAEGKKIQIKAPLLKMSKKDIVKKGLELGVPFNRTWSCYQGLGAPCGLCDSCLLRAKGFEEAGITDTGSAPPSVKFTRT